VWVTYQEASTPEQRRQLVRDEAQARAVAENLRARSLAGEDLGRLALLYSVARGSVADGFVALPVNPAAPDERDLALMRLREGETTPLLRWRQGWWFARRIDRARAVELKRLYEEAESSEARGQAIVVHYQGAWPYRYDETLTRSEAGARAERLLNRLRAGEDFAAVARQASADDTGNDGGMLRTADPTTGQRTYPWIRLGNPDFPTALVNVLLRGEVGQVVPEVLDTSHGFLIVKPLERRRIPR
jgi:parvulin-like peptidyl-prolyl isomerase